MYCAYKANLPDTRIRSCHSFDALSNQFAWNLVELVVDKTPEVTNSRTGYHIALGYGQAINAVNGSDPGGLSFDQYLKRLISRISRRQERAYSLTSGSS